MKVLLVGSGAREHALAWKIAQSPLCSELVAAPGNSGIARLARCVPVAAEDVDGIVGLSLQEQPDLVVIGPEDPLADGLSDRLRDLGIKVFGPSAAAARLEASKAFAKSLMFKYGIPTAEYKLVTSLDEGMEALTNWKFPVAVKADGLARGRGVTIAYTREEAETALRKCMVEKVFGEHGANVVLEEFLEGEEVSLIGICDGKRVITLAPAEDHKPVFDGDTGPNTGGMGAFSPVPAFSTEEVRQITRDVMQKTVEAMAAEGSPFSGALFAGLILTESGPKVLEFNVRFGDPETEVILPRMKSDLLPLLLASAEGSLPDDRVEWSDQSAVCVILASGGYPGSFEKGKPISGIEQAESLPDTVVFCAGATVTDGQWVTSGGRVLAITALGSPQEAAIDAAYRAADTIHFDNLHRRGDICRRRLKAKEPIPGLQS